MAEIKDFLANILFIILPICLYQILWIDHHNKRIKNIMFIIACSVSVILCMSFPIIFEPGFRFDLRQIPLILALLYKGYRLGIWLVITILSYRFFLGGDGVYVNFLVVFLIFSLVPLLSSTYHRMKLRNKIVMVTTLAVLVAFLTVFFAMIFSNSFDFELLSVEFIIFQGLGMWIVSYFIESLFRNIRLREEIQKVEKLSVVSQLAASIAHEVRNPLTVTRGFIQLLQQKDCTELNKQIYGNLAISELDRAQRIITDFLSLAKPEMEKSEAFDVVAELNHVKDVMSAYANMKSCQITMRIEESSNYNVYGNIHRFRQCFINIIKNSIEAINQEGTIDIVITSSKKQVLITIQDTGVGMSSEQIARLGTPYYSSKEKGTGLGMFVVYNTIHAMNGTILVESEVGVGTKFSFYFPLLDQNQKQNKAMVS